MDNQESLIVEKDNLDIMKKNFGTIVPIGIIAEIKENVQLSNNKIKKMILKGKIREDFPLIEFKESKLSSNDDIESFTKFLQGKVHLKNMYGKNPSSYVKIDFNLPEVPAFSDKYEFLAKIEIQDNGKYLFFSYTNEENNHLVKKYRKIDEINPCKCEHCNVDRKRNATFVIHDKETNETTQVGSSCMKDFIDDITLRSLYQYEIYLKSISEIFDSESFGSYRMVEYFDKISFLAAANKLIENNGFIKKYDSDIYAMRPSTYKGALDIIDPVGSKDRHGVNGFSSKEFIHAFERYFEHIKIFQLNENDFEKAKTISEYLLENIDDENCSEFEFNLKRCLDNGFDSIELKEASFLSYAPMSYRKMVDNIEQHKKNKKDKESNYVVGDFLTKESQKIDEIQLKLTSLKIKQKFIGTMYDGYYIDVPAYMFKDEHGRMVGFADTSLAFLEGFSKVIANKLGLEEIPQENISNDGKNLIFIPENKISSVIDDINLDIKNGIEYWITLKGSAFKNYTNENNPDIKISYINRVTCLSDIYHEYNPKIVTSFNEKYNLGELKIVGIEEKNSSYTKNTMFKYSFVDFKGEEYSSIRGEKLDGVEIGNILKLPFQNNGYNELSSIVNGRYELTDSFSNTSFELITKNKAEKFLSKKKTQKP